MYKVGDIIYLTQEYCEKFRVSDIPWVIINLKYYKKHFDSDYELSGYTIKYGNGGHDVSLTEIDHVKTIREQKLNLLLNETA